jgi:trk system potassium uptake protein TrkH
VSVSLLIALILFRQGPSGADSIGVVHDYRDFGRCLRDGVFQTVSLATGTGYVNADFQSWPKPALYLIFICMFIGGCTGSTTGGFKVFRVLVCAKLAGYVLRHFVRPRSVEKLRLGHNLIADRVVVGVLGLLLLWIATVTVGAFVLMLDPHLDFVSSVTASLSMMGCVGPAFGDVAAGGIDLGPYAGYGELHPGAKVFMSVQMVLGRLEILLPLALLTPGFWRR